MDEYRSLLLTGLAVGYRRCRLPYDRSYLNQQLHDTVKTAQSLTVILQGQELNLEQRLTIRACIVHQLQSLGLWIDVQFVIEDRNYLPEPIKRKNIEALHMKRQPRAIPLIDKIVAIASGKGGVGKSTVSANLAIALASQGINVGLLDADIYGPSLPMLFGQRPTMIANDDGKLQPLSVMGVRTMSFGYLSDPANPAIWRGPLVSKAFRQMCYQVAWGELDYLLIDLPPGTGDIQLTMLESLPVDGAIIVTTPQRLALADGQRAVEMFRKLTIDIIGVIRNMAHYRCRSCQHEEQLFGDQHESWGIEVLAELPVHASFSNDPLPHFISIFNELARRLTNR